MLRQLCPRSYGSAHIEDKDLAVVRHRACLKRTVVASGIELMKKRQDLRISHRHSASRLDQWNRWTTELTNRATFQNVR